MARIRVQRHAQGKQLEKNGLRTSNRQTTSRLERPPQISTSSPLTWPLQTFRCAARPITPPQSAGVRGLYRCIVDYDRRPFSITWSGSAEYPDLENFPLLKKADVSSVHQSSQMAAIWRGSRILDYGSFASIRIAEHDSFPVLKLAHLDELSIKLL